MIHYVQAHYIRDCFHSNQKVIPDRLLNYLTSSERKSKSQHQLAFLKLSAT